MTEWEFILNQNNSFRRVSTTVATKSWQHQIYTAEDWCKVMFSDVSNPQEFVIINSSIKIFDEKIKF